MAKRLLRGSLAAMFLCIACALTNLPNAQAGKTNDQTTALQLVEQALAHEAAGDVAARDNALQAALKFDSNCEQALWRSGFVRYQNKWVKFDELPQLIEKQPKLFKYRNKREEYGDNAEDQLALARWCAKQGLTQQARSHLTRVLHHDPEHAIARTELGFRRVNDRWVLQEEIDAAREMDRVQQVANRTWLPKLEKIASQLTNDSINRQQVGLKQLHEIEDPLAIQAIEAVLSSTSPDLATMALEAISSMPQHEATLSLARHALYARWENTRGMAASLLKLRNEQEYVPALLASMFTPIISRTEIYAGRGGQLVYRHSLAREGQDATRVSVLDRAYQRMARPGGDAGDTAARALANAQQLAEQRELAIAAENARTAAQNARVAEILAMTTGERFGPKPELWWEWWNDHNGVYIDGEKQIVSNYEQQTVRIADEGGTGAFGSGSEIGGGSRPRSYECLRAGTPVWTERGLVAIEKIKLGDRVLAQDPNTGEIAYKAVLRTTVRPPDQLFRIVTDKITLETSSGHPFWVQGKGWVTSRFLKTGDKIQGLVAPAEVVIGEELPISEETYNLVVADFHSYFVGEAKVLSHDNTIRGLTNAVVPGLLRSGQVTEAVAEE